MDFSLPMIESGKKLANGNHPNLNWICGKAEDATLNPPYSLITAGHSLHWLDWEIVMPRFAEILVPDGYLAVVSNVFEDFPWSTQLRQLRVKYRGYETCRPHSVVEELEKRGLFKTLGEKKTPEVVYSQALEAYIEQYQSRGDMARVQIGSEVAKEFDAELKAIVSKYIQNDTIGTCYHARVVWGKPKA